MPSNITATGVGSTVTAAAYQNRCSDEALAEHLKLQRITNAMITSKKQTAAPMSLPQKQHRQQIINEMNTNLIMRNNEPASTSSIYIIAGKGTTTDISSGIDIKNINRSESVSGNNNINNFKNIIRSNPSSLDRKEPIRLSWHNMHRKVDENMPATAAGTAAATTTTTTTTTVSISPSPQTTRSYISVISTSVDNISSSNTEGNERNPTALHSGAASGSGSGSGSGVIGGTLSGRTTAASGRISNCGATTISGSNNTLNDIISDYHSHEAGSSDYPYSAGVVSTTSPTKNFSSNGSYNLANGSTVKLLPVMDDEKNQQTKCSVFRGLMLCICLNVTYANIVRFPRELDRYGLSYLIPYIVLLFLVGLPVILLEISVGQFLGQGAAHTWRASPIFKGACIISRFASWLSTIWISLQAVLAVAYTGMFLFNSMPFRECGGIKRELTGYRDTGISGQECLQKTFLLPFWENPLYFGLFSIGLICLWIIVMLCTHNGKILRRTLFIFGLFGFLLLCCLTGWEVHNSFEKSYFPELWPFDTMLLLDSNIWFNALMQVIFATNCGFGALPVLTGKFLYKGDAVRTSVVYLCFNLLINAIAVTLFMVQFDRSANSADIIDELKPLTAIYDRILFNRPSHEILVKLIPSLIYTLILIAAFISIVVAIYTSTRLVPRHPNYVIGLIALVVSIISLSAPKFLIDRILDTRIVATIVITALVFELIAITWIYGAKNIYTDLEFSIGRPIFKGWMALWCICPVILTGILVWWCADDNQFDLLANYMPRWAPIVFALAIIFIIACIQIFRQVEYNFFGMICEASKSAKEWGPADPLARHAWKQWRSVCQDTGCRDFTLRRRGTRDYTHSIKKGQYSTSNKYANGHVTTQQNWKANNSPGNSSPNYSGSMFGDSAIEEDISVDKFPGVTQQFTAFQTNDGKPLRYSHRSRLHQQAQPQSQHSQSQSQSQSLGQAQVHQQHSSQPHNNQSQYQQQQQQQQQQQHQQQQQNQSYRYAQQYPTHHSQIERQQSQLPPPSSRDMSYPERHREIVYIRRLSDDGQHATRIEITPSNESITYAATRNPLARNATTSTMIQPPPPPSHTHAVAHVKRSASSSAIESHRNSNGGIPGGAKLPPPIKNGNDDHICWRKFSVKTQEFSTEL